MREPDDPRRPHARFCELPGDPLPLRKWLAGQRRIREQQAPPRPGLPPAPQDRPREAPGE